MDLAVIVDEPLQLDALLEVLPALEDSLDVAQRVLELEAAHDSSGEGAGGGFSESDEAEDEDRQTPHAGEVEG